MEIPQQIPSRPSSHSSPSQVPIVNSAQSCHARSVFSDFPCLLRNHELPWRPRLLNSAPSLSLSHPKVNWSKIMHLSRLIFSDSQSRIRAMATLVNGSFASPLANAPYPIVSQATAGGLLARVYNGTSGLSLFITAFLLVVAYDQCKLIRLDEKINMHG